MPSWPAILSFCVLVTLGGPNATRPISSTAQTRPPLAAKRIPLPTILTGRIATISPSLLALTVGRSLTQITLTDKTRWWAKRNLVNSSSFIANEVVVVHVRHLRNSTNAVATEVSDDVSWKWLTMVRKTVLSVTIAHVGTSTITTTPTPAMPSITYHLSPHTLWAIADKEVHGNPFTVGSKIWVVPRSSPTMGVMARAVADTRKMVMILKERLAPVVRGVLAAVTPLPDTVTLHSVEGDLRTLQCAHNLVVMRGKKAISWQVLSAGEHVTVRLHKNEEGKRVVWKIVLMVGR